MRLLNTENYAFHEVYDEDEYRDRYAILSHRWGTDEALFHTFDPSGHRKSAGAQKVISFCDLARLYGYEWAWIDTCCIDKRSESESSEAIRSMYRWYENSAVCFVHLNDVGDGRVWESFTGSS